MRTVVAAVLSASVLGACRPSSVTPPPVPTAAPVAMAVQVSYDEFEGTTTVSTSPGRFDGAASVHLTLSQVCHGQGRSPIDARGPDMTLEVTDGLSAADTTLYMILGATRHSRVGVVSRYGQSAMWSARMSIDDLRLISLYPKARFRLGTIEFAMSPEAQQGIRDFLYEVTHAPRDER